MACLLTNGDVENVIFALAISQPIKDVIPNGHDN